MMYSGSLFWNEVMPRIRTVLREPGEPLASTVTPDTLPSSRCSTLVEVCFWRFSTSTVPTAPVISDRRCDVYPVTTTSGNTAMARSSETFIVVRPATPSPVRSEEHTSELQSHSDLVCRLLLEKKKNKKS